MPAVQIHHDCLYKWLLKEFIPEFFAHYFPETPVARFRFLDKEFQQKLESYKASLEADLLIALEVQLDGTWFSVVVCLEHKSWRAEVATTVMEYAAWAWLAEKKPVWSIVFFTDEGDWREEIVDRTWLGYSKAGGRMMYVYDIIKVNRELSADLIAKRSLFLSLLALRANRTGLTHAEVVTAVYRDAAALSEQLSNDQKLLIEQLVEAYSKLDPKAVQDIKEQQNMRFVANSITEHYEHIGELRGKKLGEKLGELRKMVEVGQEQLRQYEALLAEGILSKRAYSRLVQPLLAKVALAEAEFQALNRELDQQAQTA
jgi:hypothetical protein